MWMFSKLVNEEKKVNKVKKAREATQIKLKNSQFINSLNEIDSINSINDIHNTPIDLRNKSSIYKQLLFSKLRYIVGKQLASKKIKAIIELDNGETVPMTLNDNNFNMFDDITRNEGIYDEIIKNAPGVEEYLDLNKHNNINTITIVDMDILREYRNKKLGKTRGKGVFEGRFFSYLLTTDLFDLSEFQIYNKLEDIDRMNCFIFALKQSGKVSDNIINALINDIPQNQYISKKAITFYANKYNLNIRMLVYYENAKDKFRLFKFGNEENEVIELLLFKNHIMINKEVSINPNYFRFRDCETADNKKIELIKSVNKFGRATYYSEVPKYLIHQILPKLFLYGAFKPITLLDIHETQEQINTANKVNIPTSINNFDFVPYIGQAGDDLDILNDVENLYMVGGEFYNNIKQTVRGGRVYCKKCKINEELVDIDIHSLYPYAMTLIGIPTGIPKITHEYIHTDYTFNYIRVRKINTHTHPILLTNLNLGYMWINGIDLKELIKYCVIEFDYIVGYYYETVDYKIGDYINEMYKKRQNKNNEMDIKLKLNSIYGKCLKKPNQTFTKDVKNVDNYISRNWNNIVRINRINKDGSGTITEFRKYNQHYNLAQFGSLITAQARRIMNNYIHTLYIYGVELIYSDTDNLIIRKSDFDELQKYNMFRMGDNMGEFHYDYGPCQTETNKIEVAKGGIFVSKKRYLLILGSKKYKIVCNGKRSEDIKYPVAYFNKLYNAQQIK